MNSLIQISDCHISQCKQAIGVNTHDNLQAIVKKITTIEVDALLISGDLSHNGSIAAYQILKKILAPVQTNIMMIAGNHDNKANLAAIFAPHLFEQLTLGLWEIISVDSVQVNKISGRINKQALARLDDLLKQSTAQYVIVVLHHPIISMNSTWDDSLSLENPKELFGVLGKYSKIQAVLFGHAHEAAEFNQHNLKIIACPSTAKQFNQETRIGFNHYILHDNGKLSVDTQWL